VIGGGRGGGGRDGGGGGAPVPAAYLVPTLSWLQIPRPLPVYA
jgi:hypothetical protein